MKKRLLEIIKSQEGSILLITVAIIIALIGMVSSFSLVSEIHYDSLQIEYSNDKIQEEMLLRTEAKRTELSIEFNDTRPLPDRTVEINTDDRNTVYHINNQLTTTILSNFMGYATEQVKVVESLITAERGYLNNPAYKSPIKRYTEKYLHSESLAQYQYFTDVEESENADGDFDASIVKFWGYDEFWGKVHSNDDIYIQNVGGWPTFHDFVSTAGEFLYYPTGDPLENHVNLEEIFLGGWADGESGGEHIVFEPNADDIRSNGVRPFANIDADIVYVKINNTSYQSKFAQIQSDVQDFTVYSWYPADEDEAEAVIAEGGNWFEDADSIWTNHIPVYDTIWQPGPSGSVYNQSVFVEQELWIEGTVGGKQTWGCADTIYITNDIVYSNTDVGDPPDDEDSPNTNDFFGLVSEGKILIRYKHYDPFTDEIVDDNCNDVYLYGAYAAIADGDESIHGEMACHYDGIFTFQYHHPHGSTPHFTAPSPYTGNDTTYTYIDFHKYIFPISNFVPPNLTGFNLHGAAPIDLGTPCGYPFEDPDYIINYPNNGPNYYYPYGTDYPHYNPVWPESEDDIVYERGDLYIFGAIAQRRRGFIHRSGTDPYNHPQGNSSPSPWNMSHYHYDGNHPSTGYNKNYHYDERFLVVQPPDYPEIYRNFGTNTLSSFDETNWFFKVPPE